MKKAELQELSDRTVQQAFAGLADSSNPQFAVLFHRYAQLTTPASELGEDACATNVEGQATPLVSSFSNVQCER